jgi:hypothetical protein
MLRVEIGGTQEKLRGEFAEAHKKLRGEFVEAHGKLRGEFSEAHQTLRTEFSEAHEKLHGDIAGVQAGITGLHLEMHAAHVKQLRWLIGFCTGSMLAAAAIVLAAVQLIIR